MLAVVAAGLASGKGTVDACATALRVFALLGLTVLWTAIKGVVGNFNNQGP